jgi:glycosyltransferase involved in cell wall biosynthesis
MRLSVIVPAWNEEATVEALLRRVLEHLGPDGEVVVVNDASTDATSFITRRVASGDARVKLLEHEKNQGKGAAVRSGLAAATGDVALIQDADLEYDPADYPKLMAPLEAGEADAVFGSRYLKGKTDQEGKYFMANRLMTRWFDLMFGTRLTDVLTCYKAFVLEKMDVGALGGAGFEIEIELAANIVKRGMRLKEVAISYAPRTKEAGKKIRLRHAVAIAWAVWKYRWRKV